MIEEWRTISGYEGLYEVSSYGRVKSVDRYVKSKSESYRLHKGKVLSPGKDKGYLQVTLSCDGKHKMFLVHRLVAQAFIPNIENLPEVNHKDEDKTNNIVENLEWCDRSYNNNYGTRQDKARETLIKNGSWTGLSKKDYNQKYYLENKDKIKDYKKEYRKENKDKLKEYYHQYYLKKK